SADCRQPSGVCVFYGRRKRRTAWRCAGRLMIIGIGNDLCDIRRIEKTIARFGDRFLSRVFTEEERRKALSRAHPAWTFAKRFAAKEAATKALGTGFRYGVHFRDIGVVNAPTGRPTLALSGGAARHLAR